MTCPLTTKAGASGCCSTGARTRSRSTGSARRGFLLFLLRLESALADHLADLQLVLRIERLAALLLRLHVLHARAPAFLRLLVGELGDGHALPVLGREDLVR